MIMKGRAALVIAIVLICLPAALAAVDAIVFYVSNRSSHTMMSSGGTREYTLHVPPGYDANNPIPLVISMHGAGLWPAAQQEISQWDRVADREGFIVVYPSGRTGRGPRVFGPADSIFIADLIDTIQKTHAIDPARIYANGHSNGGGMSFMLSCTMRDRIAAVGLVSSAQTEPWGWCLDARPVPMIAFHGTNDKWTPYLGGRSAVARRPFPSIVKWTENWARRNRCAPTPQETQAAPGVTRLEYIQCADNAPAILYTIRGGGHTWPGGGYLPEWFVGTTTQRIDASSIMWDFFSRHPKPGG